VGGDDGRGTGRGDRGAAPADGAAATPDDLIGAALRARRDGDEAGFRWNVDQLTARPDEAACAAADRALFIRLTGAVSAAGHNGWRPDELVRQVRRAAGAAPARITADAVAADLRRHDPATVDADWTARAEAADARTWWGDDADYVREWTRRENALRAEWIEWALDALHAAAAVPPVALLGPPPGRARRAAPGPAGPGPEGPRSGAPVDTRALDRVRALLAKAEGTDFPAEAEALTARAQELMARHRIDAALLAAAPGAATGGPSVRRVPVDDPYPDAKAVLLDVVADANGCRAVWDAELGWCTVVGFPAELDAVEVMFTSLLVQATGGLSGGRRAGRKGGGSRSRSFRQSYLHGFAQRVGERLRAAVEAEQERAAGEAAAGDLLPVLAARDREVADTTDELFPATVRGRVRGVYDHEGWVSGTAAADDAALGGRDRIAPPDRGRRR
jgi:hypothetical protein